jgi:5-methyltetrahydrofolate--homocysteine methyltransferase
MCGADEIIFSKETKMTNHSPLQQLSEQKTLILDGAMGTMIQSYGLTETDFRGKVAANHPCNLAGCNDMLCLTRPDVISQIHNAYLAAGADIIETNSFNSNAISLADYQLQDRVEQLNRAAARIAREAADSFSRANGRQCFVAGSVGPTNKSLTMAVTLNDSITWDEMTAAYFTQIKSLIEGGVDLLLIETIFDTLNAKAAIYAAHKAMEAAGRRVEIVLSVTLTQSGRTLSGQTLEAFVASVSHAGAFAIGLNCGFGIEGMIPYIEQLQPLVGRVSVYANAGLPDKLGNYCETPQMMADALRPLLAAGKINIVGGCCGTTPAHIAAIAQMAKDYSPRRALTVSGELITAGLEPLAITPQRNFVNVGERCNVAGSRKFLRLIKEGEIEQALDIARKQVATGAQIIDINMDDGMLDAADQMSRFIALTQVDPDIARVPLMVDSSDINVILAGLKHIQGKPIVNSISLKEGEEKFLARAREIHLYGAAMVVMAFDEQGQAATTERKIAICRRSYELLTSIGIPATDIIFDPNILAVATGLPEHSRYALNFLEALEYIKRELPGAKVSGGLSNLSFAFRGNNAVREAMHSLFLRHAIARGMDMAIVNAAALPSAEDIEPSLAKAIDDVLFDVDAQAADRLTDIAHQIAQSKAEGATEVSTVAALPTDPVELLSALVAKGQSSGLEQLIDDAVAHLGGPIAVINGPLMDAMNRVGRLFGEGKLFLPQVVKSASAMKAAVDRLTPLIAASDAGATNKPKMVIATVKGDVHDIGKNIVSVIMRCNGFDVVDLGVMVPAETIVDTAVNEHADLVGLSGLITPSLEEMANVARLMESRHLRLPLLIGGATTSELHTAVKLAPLYSGVIAHSPDAAAMPGMAKLYIGENAAEAAAQLANRQAELRQRRDGDKPMLSLAQARQRAPKLDFTNVVEPRQLGVTDLSFPVEQLRSIINWRAFLAAWKLDASLSDVAHVEGCDHCRAQWLAAQPEAKRGKAAEAMQLIKDANRALDYISRTIGSVKARVAIVPAGSTGDAIAVAAGQHTIVIPTLRQQSPDNSECLSLCDFVAPLGDDKSFADYIGLFAVTTGMELQRIIDHQRNDVDEYNGLLYRTVADRLAEAATEAMHRRVATDLWGFGTTADGTAIGIRPAVGYPSLPDQSLIKVLDEIVDYNSVGIYPTEIGALNPAASTTGLILPHRDARYFILGRISDEQRSAYIARHPLASTLDLTPFLQRL